MIRLRWLFGVTIVSWFVGFGLPQVRHEPACRVVQQEKRVELCSPLRNLLRYAASAKPSRPGIPRGNVSEVAPRLAQFEIPLDAVVRGYNSIELAVEHGGPQTVIWLEILIDSAPTTR